MMVAIVATVAVAVGVVVAAAAATIAGKQNVRFVIVHGIGRSAALRRHGGKAPEPRMPVEQNQQGEDGFERPREW